MTVLARVLAVAAAAVAYLAAMLPDAAQAHGVVGNRFFPATIAVEDPFVVDELAVPTISSIRRGATGEDPSTRETEFSLDLTKRITPSLGLVLGGSYSVLS